MTSFLFFSYYSSVLSTVLQHLPKVILYGKLMELPKVLELTNSARSLVLSVGVLSRGVEKRSHKFFELKDRYV